MLALALVLGAPLAPVPGLDRPAVAADLAEDRGHALVVHAPSPTDPRYARMRIEFAAIEVVWRDAGVSFVGLPAGLDPEIMGELPDGLSIAALRRTAPADGGFAVRLVRADGRLVHSSSGEVHRAVLLGIAMDSDGEREVRPARSIASLDAAPSPLDPSRPQARVREGTAVSPPVPVPTMRPRAAGETGVAGTGAAPVASDAPTIAPAPAPVAVSTLTPAGLAETTLDWGARADPRDDRARVAGTETGPEAPPISSTEPPSGGARSDDPPSTDRSPLGLAHSGTAAPAPAPTLAPKPARTPRAAAPSDPWSLWSGSAKALARPSPPDEPDRPADPSSPAPHVVAAFDPLPAALPDETLSRVREAMIARRLEAAKENGFETALIAPELPLAVRANMALADGASLSGPDLGLALLVTRSCGAAHPVRSERRGWWFGG